MSTELFGRDCHLGWGYSSLLGRLVPVNGSRPNYQTKRFNFSCLCPPSSIASSNPPIFDLGCLVETKSKKYLDFCVIFDEERYWLFNFSIRKRYDTSRRLSKYPQNCDNYVSFIEYGVDLRLIFPKKGFPEDSRKVKDLFEKKALDEDQKKTKCRVLVNFLEFKEMTLGELLEYREELKNSKNPRLTVQMNFYYSRLHNSSYKEIVVRNKENFNRFLYLLFFVFRKIEMKLEKIKSKDILEDEKSKSYPLEESKKSYEKMDRKNFIKMYPVMKKLFFSYLDYLRDCFIKNTDVEEGDNLPGSLEELEKWILELSDWIPENPRNSDIIEVTYIPANPSKKKSESLKNPEDSSDIIILSPIEVVEEWKRFFNPVLVTPPGHEKIIQKLRQIDKYKKIKVFEDLKITEIFISVEYVSAFLRLGCMHKNGFYVFTINCFDYELSPTVTKFLILLWLFCGDMCIYVIGIPFFVRYSLVCKNKNVHFSLRSLLYLFTFVYEIIIITLLYLSLQVSPVELTEIQMKPYLRGNDVGRYWNFAGAKIFSFFFLSACFGIFILQLISFSSAIYFNYKVLDHIHKNEMQKEHKKAYKGLQNTMAVQLASQFFLFVIPFSFILLFSLLGISYVLPFQALVECGPTITTICTLISVPQYRKNLKNFFSKITRPIVVWY